jgi:phage terminase large subunit-like protein
LRGRWNLPFLDELRDFPHGNKDDQVDALSRAFMTLLPPDAPTRRLHIPHLGR